jgi:hypothetical protein
LSCWPTDQTPKRNRNDCRRHHHRAIEQAAYADGSLRRTNSATGIEELAGPIAAHGLMQALVVRKGQEGPLGRSSPTPALSFTPQLLGGGFVFFGTALPAAFLPSSRAVPGFFGFVLPIRERRRAIVGARAHSLAGEYGDGQRGYQQRVGFISSTLFRGRDSDQA